MLLLWLIKFHIEVLGGNPSLLYPTSKGAIIQMTRAMAAQHGPENIRVNCVCPGMVFTPMVRGRGMTDEMRQAVSRRLVPSMAMVAKLCDSVSTRTC